MSEPRRRFRFLKELSEGAFGKVYLAEMITGDAFKSVVAIKLLHGKWGGHEEIVRRSRDEARVLGLLHHRNIIRVDDLTSLNGQCAIVMEYLDGVDIKNLINYSRELGVGFPRKVSFEIGAQIAAALDAAYNHRPLGGGDPLQVIHRDIKPSNVMITTAGEVKVLDFGTAQARFDEREAHTQALAFGSAAYMAPERLLGDPDAPSGDVFSLGITLFEIIAFDPFGKIHIRPEKFDARLERRLGEIDLSDLSEGQGEQVRGLLRQFLAYEASERPNASQCVELLESFADELSDGNLRRFCREVVKPCREAMAPEQDPNDPLTGSTLFEDSSGLRSMEGPSATWVDGGEPPSAEAGGVNSASRSASRAIRAPGEGVSPRPTPAPPVDSTVELPKVQHSPSADSAPRLDPRVMVSGSRPAGRPQVVSPTIIPPPPEADANFFAAPTMLGFTGDEDPSEGIEIRPIASGPSASSAVPSEPRRAPTPPPPLDRGTPADPSAEPDTGRVAAVAPSSHVANQPLPQPTLRPVPLSGPVVNQAPVRPTAPIPQRPAAARPEVARPDPRNADAPPRSGGGFIKLLVAALALLLVVGAGGAVVVLSGVLTRDGSSLPDGEGVPGDASKGGRKVEIATLGPSVGVATLVILPPGKAEVDVRAMGGSMKEEWDGSGRLELLGLEPGTYQTKIAPHSGSSRRATFDVKGGETCTYTFDTRKDGEEWEKSGCAPLP